MGSATTAPSAQPSSSMFTTSNRMNFRAPIMKANTMRPASGMPDTEAKDASRARRVGAGDSAAARLDALGDVGADARVLRCGDDALEEPVSVSVLVALDLDFHGLRPFPSKNFDISNPEKLR